MPNDTTHLQAIAVPVVPGSLHYRRGFSERLGWHRTGCWRVVCVAVHANTGQDLVIVESVAGAAAADVLAVGLGEFAQSFEAKEA